MSGFPDIVFGKRLDLTKFEDLKISTLSAPSLLHAGNLLQIDGLQGQCGQLRILRDCHCLTGQWLFFFVQLITNIYSVMFNLAKLLIAENLLNY